jgi:prepilin-type N-terminal cleavage/methylation domain-containing protein
MKSKGFTLIELAVVLAIIAVLAAVLTPMVTGYLDQARVARTQADVRTIADAIKLYQRDTGRWPVYASSGDYSSGTVAGGGGNKLIGGNTGSTPANGTATWNASSVIASSSLETYVNGNFTGVSTTNAFPKAGYRGPYLGTVDSDPYGQRYILTASDLAGSTNHAFVISAGPDGKLDTTMDQPATGQFVVGNDDIVSLIK